MFPKEGRQRARAGRQVEIQIRRTEREKGMCASVRVCARVSQGGRANLYLVRERKKKRVKSDEGKSGRKKSNGGQKPTHANTHIHEGTHIEN